MAPPKAEDGAEPEPDLDAEPPDEIVLWVLDGKGECVLLHRGLAVCKDGRSLDEVRGGETPSPRRLPRGASSRATASSSRSCPL